MNTAMSIDFLGYSAGGIHVGHLVIAQELGNSRGCKILPFRELSQIGGQVIQFDADVALVQVAWQQVLINNCNSIDQFFLVTLN